jgi:hypothetical protein
MASGLHGRSQPGAWARGTVRPEVGNALSSWLRGGIGVPYASSGWSARSIWLSPLEEIVSVSSARRSLNSDARADLNDSGWAPAWYRAIGRSICLSA